MSEWKEFSKEMPTQYQKECNYLWLSNGENIFIGRAFEGDSEWKYWMPIEKPELPKKELHNCITPSGLICVETHNGLMVSCWSLDRKECVHHHVTYCPNCGYSPKESS